MPSQSSLISLSAMWRVSWSPPVGLAALAAPSDIRVSDATRIMVGGSQEFQFAEQMTVPLKGLEGEHTIFKLNWLETT